MDAATDWSGVRDRVLTMLAAENMPRASRVYPPVKLEPALTAEDLAEVEAQYGIALPEEYRSFLTQVSAGGYSPHLSLMSLRRIEGRWGWVCEDDENDAWYPDPSGPFVETRDWAGEQRATLRAAGYEPTDRTDKANWDDDDCRDGDDQDAGNHRHDYRRAFGGDAGERVWFRHRVRGAVMISDQGCGMFNCLILAGPHRGELRSRDCGFNPPFEPILDPDGNRHTFRTWYLEWLDQGEAVLGRFG